MYHRVNLLVRTSSTCALLRSCKCKEVNSVLRNVDYSSTIDTVILSVTLCIKTKYNRPPHQKFSQELLSLLHDIISPLWLYFHDCYSFILRTIKNSLSVCMCVYLYCILIWNFLPLQWSKMEALWTLKRLKSWKYEGTSTHPVAPLVCTCQSLHTGRQR